MTKLDVLIKARKILSDPRRWGKYAYKQPADVDGGLCYCALGAIAAASGLETGTVTLASHRSPEFERYDEARRAVAPYVPASETSLGAYRPSIHFFNDAPGTTYEDVLKLFSDAIQAEVSREAAAA